MKKMIKKNITRKMQILGICYALLLFSGIGAMAVLTQTHVISPHAVIAAPNDVPTATATIQLPTPTATPTTAAATPTATPTTMPTATPTATSVPPTATPQPTATSVPPTAVPTTRPIVTPTAIPTVINVVPPVEASETATAIQQTATATATMTPGVTPTPSSTAVVAKATSTSTAITTTLPTTRQDTGLNTILMPAGTVLLLVLAAGGGVGWVFWRRRTQPQLAMAGNAIGQTPWGPANGAELAFSGGAQAAFQSNNFAAAGISPSANPMAPAILAQQQRPPNGSMPLAGQMPLSMPNQNYRPGALRPITTSLPAPGSYPNQFNSQGNNHNQDQSYRNIGTNNQPLPMGSLDVDFTQILSPDMRSGPDLRSMMQPTPPSGNFQGADPAFAAGNFNASNPQLSPLSPSGMPSGSLNPSSPSGMPFSPLSPSGMPSGSLNPSGPSSMPPLSPLSRDIFNTVPVPTKSETVPTVEKPTAAIIFNATPLPEVAETLNAADKITSPIPLKASQRSDAFLTIDKPAVSDPFGGSAPVGQLIVPDGIEQAGQLIVPDGVEKAGKFTIPHRAANSEKMPAVKPPINADIFGANSMLTNSGKFPVPNLPASLNGEPATTNNSGKLPAIGRSAEPAQAQEPLPTINIKADPMLETIMRQAQMGLYVLPDRPAKGSSEEQAPPKEPRKP